MTTFPSGAKIQRQRQREREREKRKRTTRFARANKRGWSHGVPNVNGKKKRENKANWLNFFAQKNKKKTFKVTRNHKQETKKWSGSKQWAHACRVNWYTGGWAIRRREKEGVQGTWGEHYCLPSQHALGYYRTTVVSYLDSRMRRRGWVLLRRRRSRRRRGRWRWWWCEGRSCNGVIVRMTWDLRREKIRRCKM